MQICVDTSAILAVAAEESSRAALIEATRGADLVAPSSLPLEVGNALSAMLRRKRISVQECHQVLSAVEAIPIRILDVDVRRAIELADRLGVYAYDAYVLLCAIDTRAPLLSIDRRQVELARTLDIQVVDLPISR